MQQLTQYQVERMLHRQRRNPARPLTPGTRLVHDLGFDSIDVVELTLNLERRFHIEIPDAELEELHTVQDVLNCVDLHFSPPAA
jgi:acyl carrier protein